MKKGYFLDIAVSVGDAFTYVVCPVDSFGRRHPKTLIRGVVRSRTLKEDEMPPIIKESDDGLKFYNCDGVELVGNVTLTPVSEEGKFTLKALPFISGEDEINDDTCSILDDAPSITSQLSESTSIPTSQATVTPSAHLTIGQSGPIETTPSSSTESV